MTQAAFPGHLPPDDARRLRRAGVGNFLDPAGGTLRRFFAELYLYALEPGTRTGPRPSPGGSRSPPIPTCRSWTRPSWHERAHELDLPLSLLGVIDDAEFADPEVVAKRNRDHTHIDRVLLGRVGAEDEAITAAHGGKSAYERLKAPLERRATGHFLREARAKVWANTRLLAAARARGDAAALERLRAELARRSAAKLEELARTPEVLFYLWIKGFGVSLDQP